MSISFTSKTWFLNFLGTRKNVISMNGDAEFFTLSSTKAGVSLYHNPQPILDNLSNILPFLNETELSYVEKLEEMLEQQRIEGILEFFDKEGEQSEFLAISILMPLESWQELRSKITNPVPTCSLYADVIGNWGSLSPKEFRKKPLPLTSSSLTLKYET